MRLHFGCGTDYKKGFINIDLSNKTPDGKTIKIDMIMDLNKYPYAFKDNSIDYIYHNHVLEHLENPERFMEECHRILKNDHIMSFNVPYKSLGGSNHKYSFDYGWITSFRKTPVNFFGKEISREILTSGWLPHKSFYSKILTQYQNINPYKKYVFFLILILSNINEGTKKIYEEIFSDMIRFNQMKVKCIK